MRSVAKCKECGIEKTSENSRWDKRGYFIARCRECHVKYVQLYNAQHKDEITISRRAYRKTHADSIRLKKKVYYMQNKDSIEARAKFTRKANKLDKAEYDKIYRELNSIKIKAKKFEYSSQHVQEKQQYDRLYRQRDGTFLRSYNIPRQVFDDMLKRQDGLCVICARTNKGDSRLHIDHDHTTGQVRELLCIKCNMGLGLFQDSPKQLAVAAEYLIRHKLIYLEDNIAESKDK